MSAKGYRELVVWQKAVDLVVEVYRLTNDFPEAERFGLTAQVRRAAVSIPSNIAEGEGRRSDGDFRRLLAIARGSLCEVETQIEIARRLGLIEQAAINDVLQSCDEISRMISGLSRSLGSSRSTRNS